MAKIKVSHIISDMNVGGAGKVLLSLLKNFDYDRFDVEAALPAGSELVPLFLETGAKVIELPITGDKSMSLKAVVETGKYLKESSPDIVHTHGAMFGRIAARFYTKSKIVVCRHSVFPLAPYKKLFFYKWTVGRINSSFCDKIIAVSPAAAQNIIDFGTNKKKITVVFNGVDRQRELSGEEKKKVREKYSIKEDDFVCAIIARLEEEKGHKYVLRAASMLPEGIVIIIAGDGSLFDSLTAEAKDMGLTNVIFTGFVPDIAQIENIMDVQLNASFGTEATSLSLLEGMSLGKPAIVSDFGGNPYVILDGENGFLVRQKSADEIAERILFLKKDEKLYSDIANKSLSIYEEKFTSQAMTRATEKVYFEVLGIAKEGEGHGNGN